MNIECERPCDLSAYIKPYMNNPLYPDQIELSGIKTFSLAIKVRSTGICCPARGEVKVEL